MRNEVLGDPPDFVTVTDQAELLLAGLQRRAARVGCAPTPSKDLGASARAEESPDHARFSVTDARGNRVPALTTTMDGVVQLCGHRDRGGVPARRQINEDFAAKPGTPNMYGLVQGEANAIAPGERMLSAMTPTIVLDAKSSVR